MSQFDEDAHIAAILGQIGEGSKVLCDLGARLKGSNSESLLERGWNGVLVDSDPLACKELLARFPSARVLNVAATVGNVNDIVPPETRFISIDVDGADWWLFANLVHRPALVVIETNPTPGMYVAAIGVSGGYGCSVDAVKALAVMKGYRYLGRTVVNAFFVAQEIPCSYQLPDAPSHVGAPSGTSNNVMA